MNRSPVFRRVIGYVTHLDTLETRAMSMLMWVIVGAALGLASPFAVLRLQRQRDAARAGTPVRSTPREVIRPRNPFAAVSIRPCAEAPCVAVLQMHHRRYLAVRAPALPVPGCDRKKCGCRYIRHADRRSGGDRRDSLARYGGLTPKLPDERRGGPDDRRKSQAR